MENSNLVSLSKKFAVNIIQFYMKVKGTDRNNVLLNQLLRSGTSIGANIHEGNYAASRADFINKFQIALKECYETEYWLSIFKETNIILEEEYQQMYTECSKIRRMLAASVSTPKRNQSKSEIFYHNVSEGNNSRSEARIHDRFSVNSCKRSLQFTKEKIMERK